jgi:hypothetical protein
MNTPTPITSAHAALWTKIFNLAHDEIFDVASSDGPATQLIADSEARAVATLTAERDQLRSDCDNETKWASHYLAQSIADKARAERAEAARAAERARLDSGQILLTVAGERVWHCGVDLRAAIDAAMKEGAK